jgi:hypothetical protein
MNRPVPLPPVMTSFPAPAVYVPGMFVSFVNRSVLAADPASVCAIPDIVPRERVEP